MYIASGALTLLLASAGTFENASAFGITGRQSSSFVSRPVNVYSKPASNNNRSNLSMFGGGGGGVEELKQIMNEGDKLSKTVRGAPGLFKVGGIAAIPAAAAIGAAITPPGLAVTVVGSAVTGVAGLIGKNHLDVASEEAAKPAIAKIIVDNGVDSPDAAEKIIAVKDKFGVDEDDFAEMCGDVYKRYIIGMVKTPITKTSEMKELTNLKNILNLSNMAVGEAHAAAAKDFYRQTCLFTPVEELEDPEHPDRMSIDKFLFLSERAFRQGEETTEAFKYEMSRVAKAFDIKFDEALERVAEVAEPFYQKALDTTRSKIDGDSVSSEMLTRARNSLGIDPNTANDMHITAFSEEVRNLLGKSENMSEDVDLSSLKFGDNSKDRVSFSHLIFSINFNTELTSYYALFILCYVVKLSKLQEILSIDDIDADYEISAEATPLFQAKALSVMSEAIAGSITPESAWEQIKSRQTELLLKDEAMKDLLASMVMQAMGKPFEETMNFANVNNEGATHDKLLDALVAKEACRAVLQQSGWSDFDDFDATFFDPFSKSSACGFLSRADRLRLYRIFLRRAVRKSESGRELTDESYSKVKEVKGMLGISDADEADEFRLAFGPELQKTLNMAMFEIMGDDFTEKLVENMKESVDKVITDYRLTDDLVAEYAAPIYMKAVTIVNDKVCILYLGIRSKTNYLSQLFILSQPLVSRWYSKR